jgi:hypothetical protein
MKPRNTGAGAPYPPPLSGANNYTSGGFKQRVPDKKILEHDRLRAIEVLVMEERERLEEEQEEQQEKQKQSKKVNAKKAKVDAEKEEGEEQDSEEEGQGKILSDEEIDERCEELRAKLLKEMEESAASGSGGRAGGKGKMGPPRDRRNLKSYQVHELAEAKIEESERLRRALGIKEDRETGEISSTKFERRRERERD